MCISQGRKGSRRLNWGDDGGRPMGRLMATTAMAICLASSLNWPSPAFAQDALAQVSADRNFNVPAQPLADALNVFGRQSGLQVTLAASVSRGVMSKAVVGSYAPEEALARLLSGTGIEYRISGGRTAVIGTGTAGGGAAVAPADGSTALDPISVFGDATGVGEIVISQKELELLNPANIADVFRGEPGIEVGSSLPMSQKVYVHGIEENNLAVTMDGGRQNNKVFHHNATNLIDPSLLKAVRVDAGIAPADVGPGALGGAIAYETKDARDLLDGDGYGGFVSSNYNFNSKTFQTGISAYGMQEGLE
ncbi:MAG: TonB-dependent receptor, partial [Ensifer adhaerens]